MMVPSSPTCATPQHESDRNSSFSTSPWLLRAEADAQSSLAAFDGAVLTALQETETALSNYAHAIERRRALQSASTEAERAARIVRAQQRDLKTIGRSFLQLIRRAMTSIITRRIDLSRLRPSQMVNLN